MGGSPHKGEAKNRLLPVADGTRRGGKSTAKMSAAWWKNRIRRAGRREKVCVQMLPRAFLLPGCFSNSVDFCVRALYASLNGFICSAG